VRSYLPDFDLTVPASLTEALELMATGQYRPLAGGTDIMVVLNAGNFPVARFLDLSRCHELRGIQETDSALSFGALATFTEVRECKAVHQHFPNLVKSARVTGALAIQNRGTLGGNIVNASPAADTPPSLLAYGAEVELISKRGTRRVAYESFHKGYKQMDLAPDELLYRIHVPKPAGRTFHFYRKVGTRQAQAISKICLAAFARITDGAVAELRVGLGSVAPAPARARNAEAVILGRPLGALPIEEARTALLKDISPIDDIRSNAHYRQVVTQNVLGQMLLELAKS
jgi:CO/xanthine dehydrogenase FAD-binding subunit